jgi:hypothetical protein
VSNSTGRWAAEPILPELPPPPAELIRTPGAQRIRVMNVDAHNRAARGGFTEALILARAELADGGQGALVAWLSAWQETSRTTGRGRFAWCRLLTDRVVEMPPPRHLLDGDEWYGQHTESEFASAVRAAAETLPKHLREAAVIPAVPGRG